MTLTEGTESLQATRAQAPTESTPNRIAPPRAQVLRTKRRPALMALGASLTALGILLGVWLVNSSDDRQTVLVVRQQVAYGEVITAGDLTTVQLSKGSGVDVIADSRLNEIVGQVAATNLTPGSLLVASQLTAAAPPGPGLVLVALAVPASRLPAGPLEAGDHLLVVDTPAPGADPPALPPSSIPATLVRIGGTDSNGITVVDVTVIASAGPSLAARSATGRIALVLQPRTR